MQAISYSLDFFFFFGGKQSNGFEINGSPFKILKKEVEADIY